MDLSLTNPALQYGSIIKFFRNPALRAQQFAQDASQAVQPSISTVGNNVDPLNAPYVVSGREMLPDSTDVTQPPSLPWEAQSAPTSDYVEGQSPAVGTSTPPTPTLPKFIRPSFASTLTTPLGLPAPINAAQSKLGKLLAVARAITQGGLAGSQAGTFGGGYEAAEVQPYRQAQLQQGVQHGALENQLLQGQVGMLPWRWAQAMANLQWRRSQAEKNRYVTPRGGGIWDVRTQSYAPGGSPSERNDPVEQRRSFAEDNPNMFAGNDEKRNFVLYGHEPKVASTNPNEWSLRLDAANGDEDAQAVIDQYDQQQRTLAGIRGRSSADNRASKEEDAANAEQIAGTILNSAGGDPDKALKLFDQHSGKITDPDQRRLGPSIRKAIRARRQINKPQSALDRIISGDVQGGLNDLQANQP